MSDVDDLFGEIGAANMQAVMGETITQYPKGNTQAAGVSIADVIVDLSSQGEQPVDNEYGSDVIRWGTLLIPATATITDAERSQQRDVFKVRGELWDCEKVIGQTGAFVTVRIRREEKASTKRTRFN